MQRIAAFKDNTIALASLIISPLWNKMGSIEALPIAEEVLSSLVPTDCKPTAVKEPKKSYYKKKNDMVWTDAEDKQLLQCVIVYGADAWSRICKTMGKSMIQCHKRYLALTN